MYNPCDINTDNWRENLFPKDDNYTEGRISRDNW